MRASPMATAVSLHTQPLLPHKPSSKNPKPTTSIKTPRIIGCGGGCGCGVGGGSAINGGGGLVDYDAGKHVPPSEEVVGVRKDSIPSRYRLRVAGDQSQRDWTVSEVARRVLELNHWEDIDGVLNCWVGRFARRNFPLLIREITNSGSLEHCVRVFRWMKNQKNYCARKDIYNMMIRLHARHNRTDQARGLFFEMQEWRCKPDVETYNALINAHGRAGQWRWAMNIMEDMLRAAIPPSRSTYNNLINACGSSGHWKEALQICKKMTDNGVGPDLVTHNIVLSAFKSGAQYSKALSYFELMKGTNIHPDTITLNIVIHCLVRLGQYGKAVDLFNSMRDKTSECCPDVVTYTSIIRAYSLCGQIENCRAVFDVMLGEGLRPNIVSYNALLGSYASRGMHVEALAVFNSLKKSGIRPDVVSYTSLLNAYGRSGQPEKAKKVFDTMKQNSLRPNIVSYNALIDAYASQGLLDEAVEVLHQMENNGFQPDIVTISTLLAGCGRSGQIVRIDSILSAAESRSIDLNAVAYNSAIGSYMSVGEYDKALNLYRLMRERKIQPDCVTFNILISGLCKLGKYTESLKYLDEMITLHIPLSKEVYSSVICAYSKQGQLTEAESMFRMMKTDDCYPDVVTYTAMIHAYIVAGITLRGVRVLVGFFLLSCFNDFFSLTAENLEKAWMLFEDMEINNVQSDSIVYSSLMKAFNSGGQPAKVLHLAELMKGKNIPFNEASIFEIISACSVLRDWRTAIDTIEEMEHLFPSVSLEHLNHCLHFLGKSGKIEHMMKLFYKIVASGAKVNYGMYSILLRNLLNSGKWRKYIEVLQWMEDSGIQPSLQMYRNAFSYACKDYSREYVDLIQGKIDSLKKGKSTKI
ncbi:Pentatricopeptide repeat-containing protein [Acorus gramineus]|uniref:Pentatricopeptide repeat-containing protein n=1 Tax=Acorus gramineus TaxID=55184 RepID=A0AAV9BN10_ACOGR|nr:Pentatricopeptide repeat-containing protein [Acorus gramineus]